MRGRVWRRRLLGGVVTYAVLEVGLELAKADPDPLRLAALTACGVAVLGLLNDALADAEPSWDVAVDVPSLRERGDPQLRHYVGLIDAHLAARNPDPALRDRLRLLTAQVLAQRYAVTLDDDRGRLLVCPELAAVIDGPPRRLAPAEIDRCLTQIEEL